mmetsp:Transcript_171197/g.548823  ORF Transcript_171197/g.548823 Transcript_171197/m.548823 type:complete len:304 (-) Transcript_171197:951-1862(-)
MATMSAPQPRVRPMPPARQVERKSSRARPPQTTLRCPWPSRAKPLQAAAGVPATAASCSKAHRRQAPPPVVPQGGQRRPPVPTAVCRGTRCTATRLRPTRTAWQQPRGIRTSAGLVAAICAAVVWAVEARRLEGAGTSPSTAAFTSSTAFAASAAASLRRRSREAAASADQCLKTKDKSAQVKRPSASSSTLDPSAASALSTRSGAAAGAGPQGGADTRGTSGNGGSAGIRGWAGGGRGSASAASRSRRRGGESGGSSPLRACGAVHGMSGVESASDAWTRLLCHSPPAARPAATAANKGPPV